MKNLLLAISISLIMVSLEDLHAQDWADLNRYRDENTALMTPTPDEHRIVFMGNSITESWLRIRPDFFTRKSYVNRGNSGQTTPQMLLRFRQDVIDLKPSVVVILAGINDIAENTGPSTIEAISGNIISMVELAKANNIEVVLCSVLPASDIPWRKVQEPAEKVTRLNARLESYAKTHHLVYVDYFNAMVNDSHGLKEGLGIDAVHPNAAGYAIMEPLLEHAIAEALNNR
jgi:lysophospholipase L1-like esterase